MMGKNMYSNTYLTKLRNTPISFEPYVNIEEDFDVMMAQIIKRSRKWVEWIEKKSQSKSKTTKASLANATPTSSQSATPSVVTTTAQGLAQSIGGGDQPPEKNISIAPSCQGSPLPVIGTQASTEEKKMEELKDGATTLASPPYTTPTSLPHITPTPSPHVTPIPSPHHSPISFASALLKSTSSPIQIVQIGDEKRSSSESTKFDEATKKIQEEEKVPSSSRLLF